MTENLENTQPTDLGSTQPSQPQPENPEPPVPALDDTQPIKPVKKTSRWRSFFIGLAGFLLLIGLGSYSGYRAGINDRVQAESAVISTQLMEQYQLALVDFEFKRYDAAKQRLEFIISKDPTFPGAQQKLTEVLVVSSIPTATVTPTLTPTLDISGIENAYQRAQQLTNAQDWQNAIAALDIVRKLDVNYKTAQVDGMYYFALRNLGNNLILQQGNLEGGIYQLTLAERFGPLDNTSVQLREGARMYIIGASFWELDWEQAVLYFSQVSSNIWDGEMTAAERLNTAHLRYGDDLYEAEDYCGAYQQYSSATTMDARSTGRANESFLICFPPTPTIEPPIPTP